MNMPSKSLISLQGEGIPSWQQETFRLHPHVALQAVLVEAGIVPQGNTPASNMLPHGEAVL